MRTSLLISLLATALCAGCTSQTPPAPPINGPELTGRTAGFRAPYDPAPTTSFQRTDGADPFAQSPTAQPGFGSAYGESRASRVEATTFPRANGIIPSATAALYYDDQGGAQALNGTRPLAGATDGARVNLGGGYVSLNVCARGGGKLPLVSSQGRTYVVGKKGQSYSLTLHNALKRPVEISLSVDGLDAIDGRPASDRKRGYVMGPGETATVDGFRNGSSAVTAFRFAEVPPSAVEHRGGSGRESGIIKMTVFEQADGGSPSPR